MSTQTTDRIFAILEALAGEGEGLRLTEIGRRVGLHKSTVSRFLTSMEERGYVERMVGAARYRLGLRLLELSSLYLNQLELRTEAQPFLQRLSALSTQAVYLAIADGAEVVYIDKVESFRSIRKYSIVGRRAPAHCTALGKALLADLGDDEVSALLLHRRLERYTPNTIATPDGLLRELASVRDRGWAEDDEEYEPGIRCIAAAVYDYRGRAIAAVSTSGLTRVLRKRDVARVAAYVQEAAAGISSRMGYVAAEHRAATVPPGREAARGVPDGHAPKGGAGQTATERRRRHADPS